MRRIVLVVLLDDELKLQVLTLAVSARRHSMPALDITPEEDDKFVLGPHKGTPTGVHCMLLLTLSCKCTEG
jgi:hypothetical protein